MKCLACSAEMLLTEVCLDRTTECGIERHTFRCSACAHTAKRLMLNRPRVPITNLPVVIPPKAPVIDPHNGRPADMEIAPIIQKLGATSIADIDNLVSELQDARDHLQSEGERIRAEIVRYTALTGAASASVKIIFDVLRAWRTTGHPAHNQSQASAFEITDAVIEDASDRGDGPLRSFG